MNRVEANQMMIRYFQEKSQEKPGGSFEEMVVWHLGTIGSALADISQSLAIIADILNREGGARHD